MTNNSLLKWIFKLILKYKIISIGTRYVPSSKIETEYVEMFNFTKTMLIEIKETMITTESIFYNLLRDVGEENIPANHKFYELKPAGSEIEEYALVSNIITGNDRYLYVELSNSSLLINKFSKIITDAKGEIEEHSSTEIVAHMFSKNDAIKIATKIIGMGLSNKLNVKATVGMTAAAAVERLINLNKGIGPQSGIGFTKLGGEYALVFENRFNEPVENFEDHQYYLFIDMINSTLFTNKYGKNKLVEIMNKIKNFITTECEGTIEGYREGGDDLIAKLPSKSLAIKAGLDSAWFALNNKTKIRAGIGRTRHEAGERAQLADKVTTTPLSLVNFELADGGYAYYIPSEFTRATLNFIMDKKAKMFIIFLFVFIISYFFAILGYWEVLGTWIRSCFIGFPLWINF
ncbi:MAG: hypothetical protein LBB45_03655 [Methanobrevibacter sp.]|jgi:hypothetical protein|nr:hypothetical protein [Candidatus Methanovirga basalitermitum]